MYLHSGGHIDLVKSYELPLPGDHIAAGAALAATMQKPAIRQVLGGQVDHMLYERDGNVHFAACPLASVTVTAQGLLLRGGGKESHVPLGPDLMASIQDALSGLIGADRSWRAFGWAAFELSALLQGEGVADPNVPLLHLMVPEHEATLCPGIAHIHSKNPMLREIWEQALTSSFLPRKERITVDLSHGAAEYKKAAAAAISEIDGVDFRKMILSRQVQIDQPIDLAASYYALRAANTPARSFLLEAGGLAGVGVSPAAMIEVSEQGRVSTQPLAGTRARSADAARNAVLCHELLSDPKEIYEHALSVQLAQQEIGSVCNAESVVVRNFMQVVQRGSVQHLASTVEGQLAPEHSSWTAFASLFPPVTTSGIPKQRARKEISARESSPRGIYSGAVLMADSKGRLDAALVIRSVLLQQGKWWLRAGAGLIATSDAARELEETDEKLRSASQYLVPSTKGGIQS